MNVLKLVYTAASESAALDAFVAFSETWGQRYPAIVKLWDNAWAEFVPFLAFDKEIRGVICTTNSIESLNSRIRRAVNARGHFPTEQARPEVRLPGDHEPRPDRQRPTTLDQPLEGTPQRVRDRLPRTFNPRTKVTLQQRVTPLT